jgi:KaiC/GvpD/RAD55 family RecA-like ATPase
MSTTWTEEFQRQILATTLRGDLLSEIPSLDPAIFGSSHERAALFPRQRIAKALVEYFDKYGNRPTPEAFTQLVSDSAAGLGPEERDGLEQEVAEILSTEVPTDPRFVHDRVREAIEIRSIMRGMIEASDILISKGGEALPEVRERLAKAMTPTARDLGGQWSMYDAADEWEFDPITFAVDGLLPSRGVVWVGGKPKQGKSLLFLYLSLALASGQTSIAGKFTVRSRPSILYVAAEDGGERLKDRRADILAAWIRAEVQRDRLTFLIKPKGLDLADQACVDELKRRCAELKVEMLVLDTWTRLSPSAGPMDPKEQLAVTQAVLALAEVVPLVVIIDHSRKNRPDGQVLSPADILGPSQKWQAADWTIMLEESGSKQRLEVYVEGKDGAESRFFLDVSARGSRTEKFTYGGTVERLIEASQKTGVGNQALVFEAVQKAGTSGATIQDLEGALRDRLKKRAIQRHLGVLVQTEKLKREGKSTTDPDARYYVAPESGS